MNRTIKFRGKSIDSGEWLYGYLMPSTKPQIHLNAKYSISVNTEILHSIDRHFYEVETETVGEFTGLLDKNGEEIYEGDIIESKYSNPAPVEFIEGQFCANYNGCCALIPSEAYVVIGNIHDHPELLNTNKADEK